MVINVIKSAAAIVKAFQSKLPGIHLQLLPRPSPGIAAGIYTPPGNCFQIIVRSLT